VSWADVHSVSGDLAGGVAPAEPLPGPDKHIMLPGVPARPDRKSSLMRKSTRLLAMQVGQFCSL